MTFKNIKNIQNYKEVLMKKQILPLYFSLFLGFFLHQNVFAQQNTLIEHYLLYASLHDAPKVFFNQGKLEVEGGPQEKDPYGWVIKTYDKKNGYLSLFFEMGDGSDSLVFAIYKKQDNSYLMAVSKIKHDGFGQISFFAFYEKEKERLKEITQQVLTHFNPQDFFKKGFDFKKIKELEEKTQKKFIDFSIKIPQKGTKTLIKLVFQTYSFLQDQLTLQEKEFLKDVQNWIIKKEIAFLWDKKTSQFIKAP